MFIRKTKITNAATKKIYWNYQLVESYRTERGPRQRILLNLGPDLDLDSQGCKELANRIEEILKGIQRLLCPEETIENLAQKYAKQLQEQLSAQPSIVQEPAPKADLHTIDVNTVEQQDPRTVGNEHLLLHIVTQLRLTQCLKSLGLSAKDTALALGLIIGRAVFPASERATHQWLCTTSGLGELLESNFSDTSLDQFYRVGDLLLKHKDVLEKYLSKAHRDMHGHHSTMALYDLSNTYMAGQARGNPKARHGVSKEKRFDCPLVTLGLVIDEHGFAKRSTILPGNVAEVSTLKEALLQLDDTLLKPIIVLDAGFAAEDNLKWLRDNHYQYVVSARQQAPSMTLKAPLVSVNASSSDVKVAFVHSDDHEEQWLYCESSAKAAVTQHMCTLFQQRLEKDLVHVATSLTQAKGRKKYTKILERIGRLKEKHKRISGCYDISVQPSEDGLMAVSITWEKKADKIESRLNGHYFLRTNLKDISPQALWHLYGNLRTIEDAFRFMKSSLGLRPVYHQKEKRVDAHLWVTILAYHLIQNCAYTLKKQGVSDSWESVRNLLSSRIRVTMQAKTSEGGMLYHRSTTRSEPHQHRIYQAMGLSPQILKVKKTLV